MIESLEEYIQGIIRSCEGFANRASLTADKRSKLKITLEPNVQGLRRALNSRMPRPTETYELVALLDEKGIDAANDERFTPILVRLRTMLKDLLEGQGSANATDPSG